MGSKIELQGDELEMFAGKLRNLRDRLVSKGLDRLPRIGLYKVKLWPNNFLGYEYQEPTSDAEAMAADASVEYLSNWLQDEKKLLELAAIGPCVLHFGWDELVNGPISISIENFIPNAMPNMDWSLNPDYGGLWFHS